MYKLRLMNSSGRYEDYILEGTTKIEDILSEHADILTGTQFNLNGAFLSPDQYTKTLTELECYTERVNVIAALKAANGAA